MPTPRKAVPPYRESDYGGITRILEELERRFTIKSRIPAGRVGVGLRER